MNRLPPHNDADEIVPGIWLGNARAANDPHFLRTKGIKAVFNCTKDVPFHETVLRRYRVPVDDNLQEEEIRNLELWSYEIVYKITLEVKKGQPILIHCMAGMQRSAASLAMYLVATRHMKTEDAIKFIQSKRAIAFTPAANFEKSIRGFERSFEKMSMGQK